MAHSSPVPRGVPYSIGMNDGADERDSRVGLARILLEGSLDAKLAPLRSEPEAVAPATPGEPDWAGFSTPARDPGLEMASGSEPLPRPGALRDPRARALCLARFAHHELQAVELFAWALLRWPSWPGLLRAGLFGILADEQRHARGYLDRLRALGYAFADFAPHSDYFWKHRPAFAEPGAYLAAMGLTLEQANLDFTLVYRDAFREAGDEASAALCQTVHDDEIGHVRFASRALAELRPDLDEIARYEESVPFPLGAARAKGRRFDPGARKRAGLGDAFIEHVRRARSSQERGRGPERP